MLLIGCYRGGGDEATDGGGAKEEGGGVGEPHQELRTENGRCGSC